MNSKALWTLRIFLAVISGLAYLLLGLPFHLVLWLPIFYLFTRFLSDIRKNN